MLNPNDEVMAAVKKQTKWGVEAKKLMLAGESFSDRLLVDILLARMDEKDVRAGGWILDGFPRTQTQAALLLEAGLAPHAFILLRASGKAVVERVAGRRVDPITGQVYHIEHCPPGEKDQKDVTGRLVRLPDDTEQNAKVRFKDFVDNIPAVKDAFAYCMLAVDDGNRPPAEVLEDVYSALSQRGLFNRPPVGESEGKVEPTIIHAMPPVKPKRRAGKFLAANPYPIKVVLLGCPLSGKGTQREEIVAEFGLVHLDPAEVLAEAIAAKTPFGLQAAELVARNEKVPDGLFDDMMLARLRKKDCAKKGWVVVGWPRTEAQARALMNVNPPDVAFLLKVSDSAAMARLAGCRVDPLSGHIYHLEHKEPVIDEIAQRLLTRQDSGDSPEAIRRRFRDYAANVDGLTAAFDKAIKTLDGEKPVVKVWNDVFLKLEWIEDRNQEGKMVYSESTQVNCYCSLS